MSVKTSEQTTTQPMRHGFFEDALGLLTGTFLVSLGIYLIKSAEAVTGGTAGLALLLSYATGISFGVLYLPTNLPFILLAIRAKGWDFTIRTLISIALVSAFGYLHPVMMPEVGLNPIYAVLVGNLIVGVGMLIIFRHRASLGGFNTVALIAQDRLGWRAGYVQLGLDSLVILSSLAVVPAGNVALSIAGGVVLNSVLAFNHRPGRYLGY